MIIMKKMIMIMLYENEVPFSILERGGHVVTACLFHVCRTGRPAVSLSHFRDVEQTVGWELSCLETVSCLDCGLMLLG